MNYKHLIDSMNHDTYQSLKQALELGKWPDGGRLTSEQKAHVMQAVIAYGERHLEESARVGFIDRGTKANGELCDDTVEQPSKVKFLQ